MYLVLYGKCAVLCRNNKYKEVQRTMRELIRQFLDVEGEYLEIEDRLCELTPETYEHDMNLKKKLANLREQLKYRTTIKNESKMYETVEKFTCLRTYEEGGYFGDLALYDS